ncbi:MAG TPA: rhodanese-like domain-containing protein [Aequorivita sp.]|nr:rhodanese-like domain-containing protein [Aequorivita sp.]
MRYFFFLIIYIFFLGTASGQDSLEKILDRHNSHSVPYISVEEFVMIQRTESLIILDAREKVEFNVSHISSAKNIGFDNFFSNEKMLQKINKDAQVIVYCSIGIRSEKIAERLKKLGFINVKNLYGGIFEWKNKGFQVVDSTGRKTENVHAFSEKWSQWLHAGNPVY